VYYVGQIFGGSGPCLGRRGGGTGCFVLFPPAPSTPVIVAKMAAALSPRLDGLPPRVTRPSLSSFVSLVFRFRFGLYGDKKNIIVILVFKLSQCDGRPIMIYDIIRFSRVDIPRFTTTLAIKTNVIIISRP